MQFASERSKAFEFFEGVAIVALGLILIAEEEGPGGGVFAIHVMEAVGEAVVAILHADLFARNLERVMEWDERRFVGGNHERFIERGGAEAGFKARDTEQVVLGDGEAFDGELLLRVDGLIGGEEVLAQVLDGVEVFDFDDGEVGGGEDMFAGRCAMLGPCLRGCAGRWSGWRWPGWRRVVCRRFWAWLF
ncbi:MAG: hypothetical protein WDO18_13635 [Acidobacteriota bacterium]